jgi:hypothetical protein
MKNIRPIGMICWKPFILVLMMIFFNLHVFSQNDDTFNRRVDSLKSALVPSKGLAKRDILQEHHRATLFDSGV